MGNVIYSASPVQAMSGALLTIALLLGLGVIGVVFAFLRKSQSKVARLAMGIAGGFLIVVGLIMAVIAVTSISSGARTITVRMNDKNVVQESCGDNGETCARYIFETHDANHSYDLVVDEQAYGLAQADACYQVTFYPGRSAATSYQRIETITRIVVTDPASCP